MRTGKPSLRDGIQHRAHPWKRGGDGLDQGKEILEEANTHILIGEVTNYTAVYIYQNYQKNTLKIWAFCLFSLISKERKN